MCRSIATAPIATSSPASRLRSWIADGVLRRDAVADAHAVPHGVHRRDRPPPQHRRCHRRARGGRRGRRAGCCPTSARRRRPRPTGSTSPGRRDCNLSPVWGLSLTAGLSDLLIEPGEPVGACTDENGVVHRVERVTDPARLAAICRRGRGQPGADRRRPPPLRDQSHLPRRGSRGHRSRRTPPPS